MIIGISGKKGHGKDLVAKIIQFLIFENNLQKGGKELYTSRKVAFDVWNRWTDLERGQYSGWHKKMFAQKVKEIVCSLIGCTMEQLEDPSFKEKPLGEEWQCWYIPDVKYPRLFPIETDIEWVAKGDVYFKRMLTPRMLMQLLGTECGRKIIHPNVWVNATMADYKPIVTDYVDWAARGADGQFYIPVGHPANKYDAPIQIQTEKFEWSENHLPNWLVTDVRFPNEVKAIKDKGGIIFRVERESVGYTGNHDSETALDNYDGFDDTIYNKKDIPALLDTMKQVLQIFKII